MLIGKDSNNAVLYIPEDFIENIKCDVDVAEWIPSQWLYLYKADVLDPDLRKIEKAEEMYLLLKQLADEIELTNDEAWEEINSIIDYVEDRGKIAFGNVTEAELARISHEGAVIKNDDDKNNSLHVIIKRERM